MHRTTVHNVSLIVLEIKEGAGIDRTQKRQLIVECYQVRAPKDPGGRRTSGTRILSGGKAQRRINSSLGLGLFKRPLVLH